MFMKFMEMMKRKNNKKGFTLVELMVVVVIIGILVAIAVPVYNGAQRSARTSAVAANVRTLEGAVELYKSENGNAIPTQTDLEGSYVKTWPVGPGTVAYAVATSTGAITTTGAIN